MEFDDILKAIGGGGRLQYIHFMLSFVAYGVLNLHTYLQMFSQGDNHFRCFIPACDAKNSSYDEPWLNFTIPTKKNSDKLDKCMMYSAKDEKHCNADNFNHSAVIPCKEYIFKSHYYTLQKNWNLVCDKDNYLSWSMTTYLGAFLVGVLIFGIIADRCGRKKGIMVSSLLLVISSTANIFAVNYYMYVVIRFFTGAAVIGLVTCAFVALSEICGKENRFLVTLAAFGSETGSFALVALAYHFRSYVNLQIAVTIVSATVLLIFPFTMESIRWLISKEKNQEARSSLLKVAKWNKKELNEPLLEHITFDFEEKVAQSSFSTIVKSKTIRKRFLIMAWVWICDSLIGYGLTLGTKEMTGNLYLNYTLVTIGTTVGCIFGIISVKYIRRRICLAVLFLLLFVCSMVNAFVAEGHPVAFVALSVVANALISTSFNVTYVYTVELFPTAIRSTALGTTSMISRFGGMVAPFVARSVSWWKPAPFVIYGLASLIASSGVLFLPETIGKALPATINDLSQTENSSMSTENLISQQRNTESYLT